MENKLLIQCRVFHILTLRHLIGKFWKSICDPENFHLSLGDLDFVAKASYVLISYPGWSTVSQMEGLLELVRAEQNIYNIVFHEVIRQVTVSCTERGQLLEKLRLAGRVLNWSSLKHCDNEKQVTSSRLCLCL